MVGAVEEAMRAQSRARKENLEYEPLEKVLDVECSAATSKSDSRKKGGFGCALTFLTRFHHEQIDRAYRAEKHLLFCCPSHNRHHVVGSATASVLVGRAAGPRSEPHRSRSERRPQRTARAEAKATKATTAAAKGRKEAESKEGKCRWRIQSPLGVLPQARLL